MTKNVVVILCGLPASGKSTIAGKLKSERSEAVHVVDYDVINRRLMKEGEMDEQGFDPEVWRKSRQLAVEEMRTVLGRAVESTVVIMDDNNFLRSMRKTVCKAAWEEKTAVCGVFVECPLGECLERNSERRFRVPQGVITGMLEVLEPPRVGDGEEDGEVGWERKIPVVHVSSNGEDALSEIDRVIDLARRQDIPDFRDREPEVVTVVEECETRMRRIVSRMVSAVHDRSRKSEIAKSLSKVKSEFIGRVKRDPADADQIVNEFVRTAGEFI